MVRVVPSTVTRAVGCGSCVGVRWQPGLTALPPEEPSPCRQLAGPTGMSCNRWVTFPPARSTSARVRAGVLAYAAGDALGVP